MLTRVLPPTYLALCLLALMTPKPAVAQWAVVADAVFASREGKPQGGALIERDGLIWAAVDDIYVSLDRGATWIKRSAPLATGEIVKDIDFYDDELGVIVTQRDDDDYVYKTTDQGLSWQPVFRFPAEFLSVSFGPVPATIIVLGSDNFISLNGGANWEALPLPPYSTDIKRLAGSDMALFSPGVLATSQLQLSADGGRTWTLTNGRFDTDCYSLECDSNGNFYIVNEEYLYNEDGEAEILFSSDRGDSWLSAITLPLPPTQPYPEFTGSLAVGDCALFAQTGRNGVVRSVDRARSWTSIGGPTAWVDARTIVALSDDTIVVIDSLGSIWRTLNSGGVPFSIGTHASNVVLSTDRLFVEDTAYVCNGTPIVEVLRLYVPPCTGIRIVDASIEGPTAANYRYQLTGDDQLEITFSPNVESSVPSRLVITYDDGSTSAIQLQGVSIGPSSLRGWLGSVQVDTLGGTACLPLTVVTSSNLPVRVRFSYDEGLTPDVVLTSTGLRVPISAVAPNTSEFQLTASAASEVEAGICFSNVLAHPAFIYTVRLIELEAMHVDPRCGTLAILDTSSTIQLEEVCGSIVLSRYLKSGTMPNVVVKTNERSLMVETSDRTQRVMLVLYDLAGKRLPLDPVSEGEARVTLSTSGLASGTYFLSIKVGSYTFLRKVEIKQ